MERASRNDLEEAVADLEEDRDAVSSILDDQEMSPEEKLSAIEEIVAEDGDEDDDLE